MARSAWSHQSHAVVENLLGCVIEAGVDPDRVGKKKAPNAPAA